MEPILLKEMEDKWCPFATVTEITQINNSDPLTFATSVNRPAYTHLPKCVTTECMAFQSFGSKMGKCLLIKG